MVHPPYKKPSKNPKSKTPPKKKPHIAWPIKFNRFALREIVRKCTFWWGTIFEENSATDTATDQMWTACSNIWNGSIRGMTRLVLFYKVNDANVRLTPPLRRTRQNPPDCLLNTNLQDWLSKTLIFPTNLQRME